MSFDHRSVLDKRSYAVYRLRTDQKKSFREIGEAIGRTGNRARQLYEAGIKRIELKKSGGENKPEFSLGERALHCIDRVFGSTDVTKAQVIRALKSGRLRPGKVRNYGWTTHREVCVWAGVRISRAASRMTGDKRKKRLREEFAKTLK